MKKQIFALLLAGICSSVIAADVAVKVTTKSSRWKIEDNCYTLSSVDKGNDRYVIDFTPTANTWYRLDWDMCYSDAAPSAIVGVRVARDGKMGRFQFAATKEWNSYSLFFSAVNDKPIKIDITLLQAKAGNFQIRHCRLSTVATNAYSLKMLAGGNVDPANNPLRFAINTNGAKIVDTNVFLSGNKALELRADGMSKVLYKSVLVPVVPGKKYSLKLWVYSNEAKAVNVSFSSWSVWGHKGKHFYKQQNFKLGSECQEISLPISIPANISDVPDLLDGANIVIRSVKGEAGKILVSDISFTEEK